MKKRIIISVVSGLIIGFLVLPFKESIEKKVSDFYRFSILKEQYKITHNGVGNITIGISLIDLKKEIDILKFTAEYHDKDIVDTLNANLIRIFRKKRWVMDLKISDSKSNISAIIAGSLCKSNEGIHPGMTVSEYLKICRFESDSILYYDGERNFNPIEYFQPFYFQTDSTRFKLITAANRNSKIGDNYENKAIFVPNNKFLQTTDYDKKGIIQMIYIHTTDTDRIY